MYLFFFCGNATSVSLEVMIFILCDREFTGLSIFISLNKFCEQVIKYAVAPVRNN